MPICKVEVSEYQCFQCGYKWTNRLNGIDGPIPKRCSKCKKLNWNRRTTTPKEIGFRRRISSLKRIYDSQSFYWSELIDWSEGLIEKFLNLDPRPTIAELERVLYGPEIALRLDSQNQYTRRGYVPDRNRPGWLKYDQEEYKKLLKQDAKKQQKLMQQIIDSRHH